MDDRLGQLLELAWRTVPAAQANEAIHAARLERSEPGAEEAGRRLVRLYELVLAPDATFDSFARDQLPKLVYHLESVRAVPPRCGGIVVAVFLGADLRFLDAGELIARVAGLLATTPDDLFRRHGTGESRKPVSPVPPLALPPGRGEDA
jgi:hypothetical protein